MTDEQYEALLSVIFYCRCLNQPWPVHLRSEGNVLCNLADAEAKKRGWQDWKEAWHETTKPPDDPWEGL